MRPIPTERQPVLTTAHGDLDASATQRRLRNEEVAILDEIGLAARRSDTEAVLDLTSKLRRTATQREQAPYRTEPKSRQPDRTKTWSIEVQITETPDHTDAKATLARNGHTFGGWGRARRNPTAKDIPTVGDELACGRALRELAAHLVGDAARVIEAGEGHDVHLH